MGSDQQFIRAIAFIALGFGTFTLWRLYELPVFMKMLW
jgi:hypothetical protein